VTPDVLKGGRIAQVLDTGEGVTLIVEKAGRVFQAEVWQDEEGNGPGHLDVSLIPGATCGSQVRLAGPGDEPR
jgi:hypothetical protein